MKTDRKTKTEKRPPAAKAVKSARQSTLKTNGKHPLAAYEHIPVGIVEASLDGKYKSVNEEFCRILGYSRQELVGQSIKSSTHEDDYSIDARLYEQLVTGKIPFYRIEKRYLRKGGEEIWVELTCTLVCDEKGKPLHTVGVVLDISDRKDVERALRGSVERLRLATESARMFTWEWDFQNQIYKMDDSFEKVIGFSAGLLPQNQAEAVLKLSPPDDIQIISGAVTDAIARRGDLHSLQYRVINPMDGRIVWLEANGKITLDDDGRPQRMFGVSQNITENKKAETALQLARQQAEQLADRTSRLQKVTAALSATLTPPEIAEVLINHAAPAFGAVSSSMLLLSEDGQTLEILESTSGESLIRSYQRFPISLQVPVAEAARSGQAVWIESRQQYLERYPHLAEEIDLWGNQAAIAIPMIYKERTLGVLTLSFDHVLAYNLEDMDYALTLARQGAQALDRARAENALRESEERLRALVSQTTAGISETDLDGRLLFVNPGFCEMLGYSEAEILEKTIWELTYIEDLEENKRLFKRMVEEERSYQFEKRFVRKDGSSLWTSVSVTVIHDAQGEPRGGVGVVLNIEKRKQAETGLAEYARQQAALYRLADELHHTESLTDVFDASMDAILNALQCDRTAILLLDESNVMRFVAWRGLSDAYRAATDGHSPWTLDVTHPQPVLMDDVRTADLPESLRSVIQAEGIGSLAFIPLISNERLIGKFMVYFDAPHEFQEGELDLSQTIARQLATGIDRKRAEEALARERETLERLFETMPVMVSMIDPESGSIRLNAEFERRLGWKSDEVTIPSLVESLYPDPEYRQSVIQQMTVAEGANEWVEVQVHTREGRVMDSLWSNISIMDGEKLVMGIAIGIDISERKQAEKRLALLAEISEALRNVDDPYELLYNISEAVGEHFQVKRALFNEIDLENDREIVHRDYHRGLDSVAGSYKISDYSHITSAEMASGRTVINPDSKTDPRTAQDYERTYAISGERAYVAVPLMRDNRWVASFWVSDDMPRQWTSEEVSLIETVAERTWAIIEKLRINTALRESEHRYRAVVESQAEMLCRFRSDGTILFANGAYARASGTPPEELTGRNFWEFVAEEDRSSVRAMLDSLSPEAPQVQIENRFYTMDGERWTLWTNRALSFDGDGHWLEAQSSGVDITERKQVEEALRASEERMRLATDAAGMYAWEFDIQNQQFTVSENFAEVVGFSADLISTDHTGALLNLSPAADSRNVQQMMSKAFESQEDLRDLQYRVINPVTGEVIWVEMNARTIYDREGKLERMYGVSQNITERKRIEEALAHERELLNRIFESIPVMLTIYDPSSKLMRLNKQFGQLIGWSSEEVAGISLMEAIYPDPVYREEVRRFMDRCQENEWMDIQMRTRDGRTLETSWSNIRLSNDLRVGIGIDITERKRAEEQLRESEQRYRFIVENTSDGIWWIELTEPMPITLLEEEQIDWYYRHAVIRQCNLGMARMYGYNSVEEVMGLPLRDVVPREDPVNLELLRRFVRSGYRLVDAESREQDKDGRQLVFLNNMVGIIENGKLKGEWGTKRDITERKRAEEALRASESLYRTIARSIPGGGVYVVDKDFRYLVAEGSVTDAFGLSREMLEGRTVVEAFPDERGARMQERLQRTFDGETVSFENTHNGRFYWTQQAPLVDSIGHAIIVTLDITERKRAEDALRQSEERFAHFMQHLPGLAWIKDIEGRYVYANAASEKAFNTPREKLYGRRDEDIFPAEVAEQFRKNDEMALQDEKGVQVIETLEQSDGVLHSSLVNKFPIPGPDGTPSLIGGTAFDVTERLQAEEALRESEERFRAILRQATAGIVRKDPDGRLKFVNEAFCKMLGRTESELIGKLVWDFMHPDDAEENKQSYQRLILDGIPFKFERRFLRKDGSVIWVDASVSPILDSTGKPQSAVAVEVDITARKQAQDLLHESERRFREMIDALPAAVYTTDAEGRLTHFNPAAVEFSGREPVIGTDRWCVTWKLYYPDGTPMSQDQCAMAIALREGRVMRGAEAIAERPDGTRIWFEPYPTPLYDGEGRIVGGINMLVDITERKQAEETLRQLNLQLEDRVLSRTAKLRTVNQTLREEIAERKKVEEALRISEAAARENEEKLRTLFELLPVGISFLDIEGNIIQSNPALETILKLSRDGQSEQAQRSRKYIRPNGTIMPPAEFASRRALTQGKTVYNSETGVVLEDGEVVWTSVSAAPVNVADVGAVEVTVDITESKGAQRALQDSRERLQILSQRLVEVQEDERRAIARELHDRVGQTLAALNINLIIISGELGGKVSEQISKRLNDSMKLVAETISLVRDVMSNLRPAVLDDYGLEAAIESHLIQFTSRYEIQTKFEKPSQPIPRLGPSIEMTFLRIAQEALMNIAKHAQATQVTLSLLRDENLICMTVRDNGIGIASWQDANQPGSHGLTIMRERAEAFGGDLRVTSVPGKGTNIEVKIPIESSEPASAQREEGQ